MSRESVMMTWYNTTTPKPTPQEIGWLTGDSPDDIEDWLSEGMDERRHAWPPRAWNSGADLLLAYCDCGIQYYFDSETQDFSHRCERPTIWNKMYRKV